ncbi:MAG: hypothetical protein V7L04_19210 [Nostoc sp.]|uniref:hypothetical protein n=1 Tax=Nostoc sp. TaxID=1180 RepID=UPI002FF4B595
MRTTTLTKAVLMIIRMIWFRANGIDTKAHDWVTGEWGVGSGEWGDEGDEGDGEMGRITNAQCPMRHAQFP